MTSDSLPHLWIRNWPLLKSVQACESEKDENNNSQEGGYVLTVEEKSYCKIVLGKKRR